ncbi:MAG: hypothetical protein FJY86_01825 [Candidatus Diapherotrites archaeon]|uniref:Uncharacterized protein n=1 Tax=Candidatus Iainarchaeum sp. TaxID=3101447 RepID=A0A8T4C6N1_9ARCH|nr:hypothetical protein [Candidatus Diapherotrites archaeon]
MTADAPDPPASETEGLTPSEKEKLLKELKERLKEIEKLKRELGVAVNENPNPRVSPIEKERESSYPISTGRVREEVEELRVPPLELLDDKPLLKKKKMEQLV